MDLDIVTVSERTRSWLNGNTERLTYERLIGKPVEKLPDSRYPGSGKCAGKYFVMIRPLEQKYAKPIPIREDLLDPISSTVVAGRNERRIQRSIHV